MHEMSRMKDWKAGLAALATVLALTAGCSSAGYSKGNKAAANIQKAANQIARLSEDIDRALASLNQLVNDPQPDLRPQFKAFSKDLSVVRSAADHIAAARRSMGEKGREFFAQWDEQLAEINNEDIRARSQSRKDEVSRKLNAIKLSYEEAEQAFKPFIADLVDIEKFLSVDLTPGGVAAVRDTVAKAMRDADPLNESIGKLAGDFRSLGVAMSSVAPKTPD